MNAYCTYKLSPKPSLDQSYTYQTISLISLYLSRYPNSERSQQCYDIVEELRNKLVEKSYISAKLYYDLEDYKSAIIALTVSLDEFPETKYREEIMYLIMRAKYLLAENSIDSKKVERYQSTVDEYYSFLGEFPESKYMKEVLEMFETSQSKLKN